MTTPIKILIALLFIFTVFIIFKKCQKFSEDLEKIGEVDYKIEEIHFPENNESVFLKSKTRGITGDSKIIEISKNNKKEFESDTSSNFVFGDGFALFYEVLEDTLRIYCRLIPKRPKNFNLKAKIEFIKISNVEYYKFRDSINGKIKIFE